MYQKAWCGTNGCNNENGFESRMKKENVKYTEDYVTFLFSITFWWMNWLFKEGYKHPLKVDDLGSLPDDHRSRNLYNRFKTVFDNEWVRSK